MSHKDLRKLVREKLAKLITAEPLDLSAINAMVAVLHAPLQSGDQRDYDAEPRAQIDSLSYEQLLAMWRFAPLGDIRFQGEHGEYIRQRMAELRKQGVDTVAASKKVGW